ncbi:MAG: hypothetical protein WDN04_22355 [Rhodospirillales bacterium]
MLGREPEAAGRALRQGGDRRRIASCHPGIEVLQSRFADVAAADR